LQRQARRGQQRPSSRKISSRKNTAANGAASNGLRSSLALRGNFIRRLVVVEFVTMLTIPPPPLHVQRDLLTRLTK